MFFPQTSSLAIFLPAKAVSTNEDWACQYSALHNYWHPNKD